uniref:Adenine-specific methyltransferase n=1 Tax=Siphoviridae sp. ctksc2 TaxID=2825645 RepID=A0A8S5US43_9CAUD|nr:MAG TPA: adenine-specific methyltransferase [Siphoviridae sp. ctksc2]
MTALYYEDDQVTLYHGDCREITEWLTADVLVTDPPYGVRWTGIATSYRHGVAIPQRQPDIAGDSSVESRDTILTMWGSRPAICFGSWKAPRPAGVRHRLIWDKQGMAPGPVRGAFMTMDEEIYVLGEGFKASAPPPEVGHHHPRVSQPGGAARRASDAEADRAHGEAHRALPRWRRGRPVRGVGGYAPRCPESRAAVYRRRAGGALLRDHRDPAVRAGAGPVGR